MESFAYLFERFPSFNQTFCSREVEEMFRQGMEPALFSIRSDPESTAADFSRMEKVLYLPTPEELERTAKNLRDEHRLPGRMARVLGRWGEAGDKMRVYEAAYLGPILKERGIRHVHAHFAGIAARTAFWLKEFYGIEFSFTGHANDIFRDAGYALSLEKLLEAARFVVTPSEFSREWLGNRFPKCGSKVFGVYNGIHVEKFGGTTRNAFGSNGVVRMLSVGRYVEKKGFAWLIEACAILKERGIGVRCEIVGEGPMEGELRGLIAKPGLEGVVTLAGPRSQAELIAMYAEADLFVLPCVREAGGGMDNLPTVIMEAMAAGVAVISTEIAGVPEMIVDGESGWVVPEKDSAALAEAIGRAAADPEAARRCAEKGRERAAELFSVEKTVRRLKRIVVRFGRVRFSEEAVRQDPALKKGFFERNAAFSRPCDGV